MLNVESSSALHFADIQFVGVRLVHIQQSATTDTDQSERKHFNWQSQPGAIV